jgi:ubiquinone/menaquinone biosynthesis C-methylase UbiE
VKFDVKGKVKEYYGGIAKKVNNGERKSCCSGSSCCGEISKTSLIYNGENLEDLPKEAIEASLGCANPVIFAELKKGETVLDLGSGGGINVLMAAKYVGDNGRVFGLDMTDEMLKLANKNKEKMGITNVDFLKGDIEDIPLKDGIIDVIMSNCVINLCEDKGKALSEAYRVLKKGGRLAIADIINMKEIPSELKEKAGMWCGCLGGTLTAAEYKAILEKAGFNDIEVVPEHIYTKSIIENTFLKDKNADDVIDRKDLDFIDGAFAGAYIKAHKNYVVNYEEENKVDSKDYFKKVADKWDTMRQGFFSEAVREKAYSIASVKEGLLAADIGAGTGFITEGLIQRGLKVIAVDQSEEMLEQMRQKYSDCQGIDYRQGEAENLPISDNTVDYVMANMYLHHVDNPMTAIKEMVRILKPGGKFVLTDLDKHNYEFLKLEHHDRWMGFKRENIKQWLVEAGLKNISIGCAGGNCCTSSSCGCDNASISIFVAYGEK